MATIAQLEADRDRITAELRIERLRQPETLVRIRESLDKARKMTESVSQSYAYGGPTMHEHSHGELASMISTLRGHVSDLLLLVDNDES